MAWRIQFIIIIIRRTNESVGDSLILIVSVDLFIHAYLWILLLHCRPDHGVVAQPVLWFVLTTLCAQVSELASTTQNAGPEHSEIPMFCSV